MELALEILLGDFEILQCHVGTFVAEQFHDGSEADAGSQHFSSICVSKLVRHDAGRESERVADLVKIVAEVRIPAMWMDRSDTM